ncbi:hypothetical protein [Pelagicoccus sp. SDUM812003]|uniref:aldose epimerase family protein n=1 Tax=Pelagicoccus sp. SDUM812003 TaxID=3041267 RepID=UPI00280E7CB2|nr:hypothetical protein [Pelagicoccus sp. SDUM812003]MDQ8204812.1 hypothetical protein [Pelagicoccus sp. SDUM812003]
MEEVEYLGARIYRWQVGVSTFLAWPEKGARLMNWNLSYADGSFRDIVHWPDLSSTDQFVKARGGNPILFPFCARTFENGQIGRWTDPKGVSRPMPMHGFARQGAFEITRIDKKGFAAKLLPTEEDQQAYPYDYEFEVIYRFDDKAFSVELRLSNQDTVSIPWSAGHHFYFTLPWADATTRADYHLKIPAKKASRQLQNGSLEEVAFKRTSPLSTKALIDRIHYRLTDPIVECSNTKDGSQIDIEIGTQSTPNPDYALVTWTESEDSPFFCIEPWMGPPNSPEHKIGFHSVGPGETGKFSVTIRV